MTADTDLDIVGTITINGRECRYRVGWESGDVFKVDDGYDGPTVTIEIAGESDGADILRALRAHGVILKALREAEACMSIVEPRSDKAEYLRILGVVRAAIASAEGRDNG